MNQQGAQVAITAFADAEQSDAAAARSLFRHEPKPGGELATVLEALSITNRNHQRRRAQGADTFDVAKALTQLAAAVERADPPVVSRDPAVELGQLDPQLADECSDQIVEAYGATIWMR
jgi:hypothetical protein